MSETHHLIARSKLLTSGKSRTAKAQSSWISPVGSSRDQAPPPMAGGQDRALAPENFRLPAQMLFEQKPLLFESYQQRLANRTHPIERELL
jgi:hypothetical protein